MSQLSQKCFGILCKQLLRSTSTLESLHLILSDECGIQPTPKLKTQIRQTLEALEKKGIVKEFPTQNGLAYTFTDGMKLVMKLEQKVKDFFDFLIESGSLNEENLTKFYVQFIEPSKEHPQILSFTIAKSETIQLDHYLRILQHSQEIWNSFVDFTIEYFAQKSR